MGDQQFHRKLPHHVPSWVHAGSLYYITLCTEPRGVNQLAEEEAARNVIRTVEHHQQQGIWFAHICLLMPDHIHMIVRFSRENPMKAVMKSWKGYCARFYGIRWQPDFFDHRIRNDKELREKILYIRMNPVRAHLTERAENWSYVWDSQSGCPLSIN